MVHLAFLVFNNLCSTVLSTEGKDGTVALSGELLSDSNFYMYPPKAAAVILNKVE